MSGCSCFALCCDNDLYFDSGRSKKKKKCSPFTDYSLTSLNVVGPLRQCSETHEMLCQSVFVRGERGGATWQCRRKPRCHTLLVLPQVISMGLWWQHLTHDRHRPSPVLVPGEHFWQAADETDWLTHSLTNCLIDRPSRSWEQRLYADDKQRGQTSCSLRDDRHKWEKLVQQTQSVFELVHFVTEDCSTAILRTQLAKR